MHILFWIPSLIPRVRSFSSQLLRRCSNWNPTGDKDDGDNDDEDGVGDDDRGLLVTSLLLAVIEGALNTNNTNTYRNKMDATTGSHVAVMVVTTTWYLLTLTPAGSCLNTGEFVYRLSTWEEFIFPLGRAVPLEIRPHPLPIFLPRNIRFICSINEKCIFIIIIAFSCIKEEA